MFLKFTGPKDNAFLLDDKIIFEVNDSPEGSDESMKSVVITNMTAGKSFVEYLVKESVVEIDNQYTDRLKMLANVP